jgi:hypothetical protein
LNKETGPQTATAPAADFLGTHREKFLLAFSRFWRYFLNTTAVSGPGKTWIQPPENCGRKHLKKSSERRLSVLPALGLRYSFVHIDQRTHPVSE